MLRPPRARVLAGSLLLFSLAACDASSPGGGDGPPASPGADVVLITVDTLRADHLGSYGHGRPTSPRIDALARDGVLFRHALAQAPWTLPSVASLHTGLYPSQHGAIHQSRALDERFSTLAELLAHGGYHTVGVVSHDFTGRTYGLAQGFVAFDQIELRTAADVTSPELAERALELVSSAPQERPLFLWVHFFDPHYDYVRHSQFGFVAGYEGRLNGEVIPRRKLARLGSELDEADMDYLLAVYDEEIAKTDEWVGRLLDGVRQERGERPSLTVLTADHGEFFFEKGRMGHGRDVFEPLVHVPLIFAGEGIEAGVEVGSTVEIRAVGRTILDYAGVAAGRFGDAPNLLDPVTRDESARIVFTEGSYARGHDARKIAAVRDGWKLIYSLDEDRFELYDLRQDPGETRPIARHASARSDAAWTALAAAIGGFRDLGRYESAVEEVELTSEERERLEALGYLQ